MKKIYFLLFLIVPSLGFSQSTRPYYNEILEFKKQDSIADPPKNAILLVGSSSFRMWKDVGAYFPDYTIINRGFGGSSLPHVIEYFEDIIRPYQPKQIVIYAGENDLTSDTTTATHVYHRFTTLYGMIRNVYPHTNVVFVSIKPSPSREKLLPKMVAANKMIRDFLNHERNANFVNVFDAMLINGKPDPSIFLADNLHMNAKGYAIWQKKLKPYLKK